MDFDGNTIQRSGDNVEKIYSLFELLKQKNLYKSLHQLEQETKLFFDLNYVLELLYAGKFKKSIKYIESFIPPPNINENLKLESEDSSSQQFPHNHQQIALKIYHDIHLQRYLEKIAENDSYYALKILQKDLQHILTEQNLQNYQHLLLFLAKSKTKNHAEIEFSKNFISSSDEGWGEYAKSKFLPTIANLIKLHPATSNILQFPKAPKSEQISSSISNSNSDPMQISDEISSPRSSISPIKNSLQSPSSVTQNILINNNNNNINNLLLTPLFSNGNNINNNNNNNNVINNFKSENKDENKIEEKISTGMTSPTHFPSSQNESNNNNNNNNNNNIITNNNTSGSNNNAITQTGNINRNGSSQSKVPIKMTVFDDLHEPIVNLKYAHSTIISLVKDGNISLYQFTDGKISHTLKLKCPVAPSPLPSDLSLSYSLSIHNTGLWGICCGGSELLIFSTESADKQESYQKSQDFDKLASHVSFNDFDEDIVAYGLYNGSIVVLNPEVGDYNDLLEGHSSKIVHIIFLTDYLISFSYDRSFCIWKKMKKVAYELKYKSTLPGSPSSNTLNTIIEVCEISLTECKLIFGQGNEIFLFHIDTLLDKLTTLSHTKLSYNIASLAYSVCSFIHSLNQCFLIILQASLFTLLLGFERGILEEYSVVDNKFTFERKNKLQQNVALSMTAYSNGFLIGFYNGKIAYLNGITKKN